MNSTSLKFDFPNKDGQILAGRLELPFAEPKSFALFAHCFTCSKDILAATRISRALTEMGIGVLRFDFTGLGNSEGDFSNTNFSSNVDDLLSAYSQLTEKYSAPQLLVGHSLGGAAVLKASLSLPEVRAVVTIGAPSDAKHILKNFKSDVAEIQADGEAEVELAGRKFKIKRQLIDDINDVTVLEGIADFKKALLVMHSPTDDIVSIDHAGTIFMAAKHPKSFVSLDDSDHLLMKATDAQYVANVIGAWAERYIASEVAADILPKEGVVRVSSIPGHKFTQVIRTGSHALIADEPAAAGGDNLGLSPYDLLLAGLGACTSMTLKMYADHKKWPLEKVSVELTHGKVHATDCLDCETKEGKIDQITKAITLEGPLDETQRARLLEIAEKCPVNRTLKAKINMVQELI